MFFKRFIDHQMLNGHLTFHALVGVLCKCDKIYLNNFGRLLYIVVYETQFSFNCSQIKFSKEKF